MNPTSIIGAALIGSFAITFIFMPFLVAYFRAKKEGQMIKEVGPNWHKSKSGTPTMGGILFILTAVVMTLLVGTIAHKLTIAIIVTVLVFLGYGLIGAFDDRIKIFHHQNDGFSAKQKAGLQVFGAVILFLILIFTGFDFKIVTWWWTLHLGWVYLPILIFWMVGWSNAVNLTDGLDGLVAGTSIISYGTFGLMALKVGATDIAMFDFALVGALIAFLWYNKKPAQIFMGDTGSLALGAGLAINSVILHKEFALLIIGIIPIIETLSVIMQVTSFHFFKKRIFKMSPIHHHFEMSGWSEWKIDIVFWIITLLGCVISYSLT
ncbi:phospho-N-acetylmuramoyl-pentapeptide-transferase [Periweissella fabalis]|uniref:Phospho-N-acetylmuramoyl-pentapeptide-transferase n=1 Tax=Periweissella fabalis TaxID=1070421 RepID=A0A7X6N352_9LACO|nr:phospho-N-acetylmuramoyl-pentapeptide-transferase [Periweissella fabalis]MCM0598480.1 phospho-N-acetylmuramoyl-pentapeptide-transferase [Periweissella fabalis]NKZ24240.1 phospho-N-acetylmuramoyl-pentapeptide-transferase [Periweissella fabalis]